MQRIWALTLLFVVLGATPVAFSANWYVRKGATGTNNGTDWNNAWNELNQINFSTVSCGDTVWIAGGSYSGSLNINKTCTSNAVLYIRRVRSTDTTPVAAAGWNSSYDSQVVDNGGSISLAGGAYYTIDGRVGDASQGIAYGIQFNYSGNSAQAVTKNGPLNHITLTHIEFYGPPCVAAGSCTGTTWGIQIAGTSADSYTMIDHCWVHRWAEVIRPWNTTNLTIQYSFIGEDNGTPADHSDLIYASDPVSNVTLRFNRWYQSANDGIWWDNNGVVNLYFYGNIVYHSGGWAMGFPRCSNSATCGPVYIYNNIFENDGTYGDWQPSWIGASASTLAPGSDIANNIFYRSGPNGGSVNITGFENYNAMDSTSSISCSNCFTFPPGSPLTSFDGWVDMAPSNIVRADFHLTAAGATLFQDKGKNLGPPYNVDMDGNIRPATGGWSVGPYEANGTQSAAPAPPTKLTAAAQ